jgi:hypothetical protein
VVIIQRISLTCFWRPNFPFLAAPVFQVEPTYRQRLIHLEAVGNGDSSGKLACLVVRYHAQCRLRRVSRTLTLADQDCS